MKKLGITTVCVAAAIGLTAIGLLMASSTYPGGTEAQSSTHKTTAPEIPDKMDFCGEAVPLDRQDVREALERELIVNTYSHTNTVLNIKRAGRYFPVIERILKENGMPDDLKYLAVAESNLMATIKSPVGARGMWQFMEGAAKDYGMKVTDEIDERLNVEKSTRAACKMMRNNHNKFGSWAVAAAAYNCGPTGATRIMGNQHQTNYYDTWWSDETSRYVFRILAFKAIMSNPAKYGFDVEDDELYQPYDTREVKLITPQKDLAQWAIDHGTTYKALRTLNPWIQKYQLTTIGDTLTVLLPK